MQVGLKLICMVIGPMYSHILDGKHIKRSIDAHLITLHALHCLFMEAFFKKYPELEDPCKRKRRV